jgi:hypothetical protein
MRSRLRSSIISSSPTWALLLDELGSCSVPSEVVVMEPFADLAGTLIAASAVAGLLMRRPAMVLERIARGGGATRWYRLSTADDLARLCERLSPGSVVSFYFDERIEYLPLDDEATVRILEIASAEGSAVVGRLGPDSLEIIVDYVSGANELGEFVETVRHGEMVFVGAFPGRDDDGQNAVTFTLPDSDGVTRGHPH